MLLVVLLIILAIGVVVFKQIGIIGKTYNVSVSPSQLDDWNKYSNTKYGYTIMYPTDIELSYVAPGLGLDVPNEETGEFEIRHPDVKNEEISISAIDYFAPRINMEQWEEINVEINGKSMEAYKSKRVEIDHDKFLFRFRNDSKEIQVDFMLSYKDEPELLDIFYGIIFSFQFEN